MYREARGRYLTGKGHSDLADMDEDALESLYRAERVKELEEPFSKDEIGNTKPFFRTLNPDGTVMSHYVHGMTTLDKLQQRAENKAWLESQLGTTLEGREAIRNEHQRLLDLGYTDEQVDEMEEARQMRLRGWNGGPQPGDVWTQGDADLALKARQAGAWRQLSGDSPGSWTQAGEQRAREALLAMAPEERDAYWKAEVLGGGDTGKPAFRELYGDIFRIDHAAAQTSAYEDVLVEANSKMWDTTRESPWVDLSRMAPEGEYSHYRKGVPTPEGYQGSEGDQVAEARHWQGQADSYNLNLKVESETDLWKALGRRNLGAPTVDRAAYEAQKGLLESNEWAGDPDMSWLARQYWRGANTLPSWETFEDDLTLVRDLPIAQQAVAFQELTRVYRGSGVNVVDPDTRETMTTNEWLEKMLPEAIESSRRAKSFLDFTGQEMTYDEEANQRVFWHAAARKATGGDGAPIFTPEESESITSETDYWREMGHAHLGAEAITDRASYSAAPRGATAERLRTQRRHPEGLRLRRGWVRPVQRASGGAGVPGGPGRTAQGRRSTPGP